MADNIEVTDVVYEFLDKPGITNLSKAILTKVNSRIQDRIVSNIDETSDENHIPSALAVYTAINKMSHIKFKSHIGMIDTIVDPNPTYIYLQKDDEEDKTWMMYIYQVPETEEESGSWITIGDTEVDLSNYWSKDASDVEALKIALGIPEEIARLDTKIDDAIAELKNLPANLLFNENGDFAIYLTADKNISLVDYMFTLNRPGMYTIYAQRGCPDNPVSASNSSFRGICHITQLESDVANPETGTTKMYGWIMLFDQDGNAHINYIRRSVASGWKLLNDKALIESEVARLEELINNKVSSKVDESQLVKLTEDEILTAVDEAYAATEPTL